MKLNWGTGLAITLAIFAIGMGYTVYQAMNQTHDLVTTDYYQQELAYQSTIDGKRNASALSGDCQLKVEEQKLFLDFPEALKGKTGELEITMYFPTGAEHDFKLSEKEWSVSKLEIPGDKLSAGKWIAKVSILIGETNYYFEPSIVI